MILRMHPMMNGSDNKARGAERKEENHMTLSIGEKVSLPSHGPCVIGAVVNKLVGGLSTAFYRLAPLEDNGGELFIPVDKITGLGIRQLLQKSEIPQLLGRLSRPGKAI